MWRSRIVANFVVGVAGFLALAAVSYWSSRLAMAAVLAWCALVLVLAPVAGWALAIVAVVFQHVFGLGDDQFRVIRYALVFMLATRALVLLARRRTAGTPMLWVLVAFAALVAVHDLGFGRGVKLVVWDTALLLSLGGIYVMSRRFGAGTAGAGPEPAGARVAAMAMIVGGLISGLVSLFFLDIPLPALIATDALPDNLRLFGVQESPNVLAQLLLPVLLLAVCGRVYGRRPTTLRWATVLTLVSAFLLAATGSRSGVIAVAVAMVILLPLLNARDGPGRARIWTSLALVALGYAAYVVGAAGWIERHAAQRWILRGDWNLCYYMKARASDPDRCTQQVTGAEAASPPTMQDIVRIASRDLRLQGSYAMSRAGGATEYAPRSFRLVEMGQRDRTWQAGWRIVAEHWMWGIGDPERWRAYMQRELGYPFTSPHNALLEIAGGYGIAGAGLYLLAVTFFIRTYWQLRVSMRDGRMRGLADWTLLCGITVFCFELTDVMTVLAFSIPAIWFWVVAGVQAGLLDRAAPVAPGSVVQAAAHPFAAADVG